MSKLGDLVGSRTSEPIAAVTANDDWHNIALEKLTRVLGGREARLAMSDVLSSMGISRLNTADDLRRFAETLSSRAGFARAVAGLLSVHVAIYGQDSM